MPVLNLSIGSIKMTREKKAELISDLTEVLHKHTGIRKEAFSIYINEFNPDSIGIGGVQLSEKLKEREGK